MSQKIKAPKLPANITQEFVEEMERLSADELKSRIVAFQGQMEEARTFLKEDEQVLGLKEAYDYAAAPSREAIRVLRARTKFVIEALKKQGAL